MRSIGLAVTALAIVGMTTAAFADAVVTPVDGSVLVSHGQGFVRQAQTVDLKIGDRVMVAQGSRAKITYGDGCAVDLLPGAVQIVRTASPCSYKAQFNFNGAQGGPSFFAGFNFLGLAAVGGVVALAAVSASISLSEKNTTTSSPTSPVSP